MTNVTQEDRDLFKALFHHDDEDGARFVDQGLFDDHRRMRAIAAHRIAAEQAQADTIASLRAELAEARRKGMMEAAEIVNERAKVYSTKVEWADPCAPDSLNAYEKYAFAVEVCEIAAATIEHATAIETAAGEG